jgi:hypothetical protein
MSPYATPVEGEMILEDPSQLQEIPMYNESGMQPTNAPVRTEVPRSLIRKNTEEGVVNSAQPIQNSSYAPGANGYNAVAPAGYPTVRR